MARSFEEDVSVLRSTSVALLTLLAAGALKLTAPVTMPLFFAVFIVTLASPLQRWLERRLPKPLSSFLTFCATLAVLAVVLGSLYLCAVMIAERAPSYQQALTTAADRLEQQARSLGLSIRLNADRLGGLAGGVGRAAATFAHGVVRAGGGLVLVLTFTMLALPEVDRWREKLLLRYGERVFGPLEAISSSCRSYVGIRTLTSALMGVLTGLFTWAVGLDFAFVWGVTSFFLNYVPTLGGIVAIIPPSLLAFLQFDALGGLGVLVVLVLVHILIGSFLDPKLQGRTMSLSPLVVLFSIAWWGFLWGIGGALLAVPLTVTVALLCAHFPGSAWIADLLAEEPRRPRSLARKARTLPP